MRPTSLAARPTPSRAASDRARILDYLRSRGIDGASCDETERALGMSHQTCSARFRDLSRPGVEEIVPSGEVRPTASGRRAMVWVVR